MLRRKRYGRFSRRNPWRNTWEDNKRRKRQTLSGKRILAALLSITLPIMCLGLSAGVLSRLDDVYRYNINATQSVKYSSYSADTDEVIALLGDFMAGKTDEFSLESTSTYNPTELFTQEDQEAMLAFRHVTRLYLLLGLLGMLATGGIYYLLLRWQEKKILCRGVICAGGSMVLFVALEIADKIYAPLRTLVYGPIINLHHSEDSFLWEIASQSAGWHLALFECLAGVVLFLLMAYLTWRLAGRRKLFKNLEEQWAEMHKDRATEPTPIDLPLENALWKKWQNHKKG